MRTLAKLFGALVLGVLVGCGPAELDDGSGAQVSGEAAQVPLTPEELQRRMEEAEKNPPKFAMEACPATNSCGSQFGSCSTWSAFFDCGTPGGTCNFNGCPFDCERIGTIEICDYAGAQSQPRYRFRTCYDGSGNTCTNVERSAYTVCGCALN